MIKSILAESDLKEVLEEAGGDKLVVVLFLTNWCGSAVKVAKNVAEVSSEQQEPCLSDQSCIGTGFTPHLLVVSFQFSLKYQDNVIFAKVDCDEAERVRHDMDCG